jgi:hypothetical protein
MKDEMMFCFPIDRVNCSSAAQNAGNLVSVDRKL